MMSSNKTKYLWYGLAIVCFGLLLTSAVWVLWNWLIPEIFNGPKITFVQAMGLLLLSRVLIGFGHAGKNKWNYNYKKEGFSDIEKEHLKHKFMEKCGWKNSEKTNDPQDR